MTSHFKTPSSSRIYFVIASGITLLLFFTYAFYGDLRQSPYWQRKYSLANDSGTAVGQVRVTHLRPIIDTIASPVADTLSYKQVFFQLNPVFLSWIIFFSLMGALGIALFPILFSAIRELYHNFPAARGSTRALIVFSFFISLIIFFTSSTNPSLINAVQIMKKFGILLYHPGRLNIVIALTLLSGVSALFGQLLVNRCVNELPETIQGSDSQEIKKIAMKFAMLREKLKFFLMIDATLIVMTIITSDALRRSILAEVSANIPLFPKEFVYIYGAVFTFYLAVFYLPIYYRLRQKGLVILESREMTNDELKPVVQGFLINESALGSLKVALSILAPILTSLVPDILKL